MDAKTLQTKLERLLSLEERLQQVERALYFHGFLERPKQEIEVVLISDEQRQKEAKQEQDRAVIRSALNAALRGELTDPATILNVLARQALQT